MSILAKVSSLFKGKSFLVMGFLAIWARGPDPGSFLFKGFLEPRKVFC